MKYIYDILLNFNESKIYNFYEWHPDDDIGYFKRVPLIKISDELYSKIAIGCVINDNSFLDSIYNTTEIYDNKTVRCVDYAVIVTNGKEAQAILLDKKGNLLMISKMLIDEEEETIDIGNTLNEKPLNIIIIKQINEDNDCFLTRYECKKLFFLNKELDDLYNNKNLVKLKYLYYECCQQLEDDIDIIYEKIKLFLHNEWGAKHDELYNLVRISYSKK